MFKQLAFIFILLFFSCQFIPRKLSTKTIPENHEIFNLIQEGDIVFQDLDSSPLCDAIEEVTPGYKNQNFSHIGMIILLQNNEGFQNGYYIIEAFSQGVQIVQIEDFLKRSYNNHGVPKITLGRITEEHQKLIPKVIEESKKLLGKKYDNLFLIDNEKYYCSEFLYEIFLKANAGKELFKLYPMTFKNKKGQYSKIWEDYFNELGVKIPEGELGTNPGKISLSKHVEIIYNYKQ